MNVNDLKHSVIIGELDQAGRELVQRFERDVNEKIALAKADAAVAEVAAELFKQAFPPKAELLTTTVSPPSRANNYLSFSDERNTVHLRTRNGDIELGNVRGSVFKHGAKVVCVIIPNDPSPNTAIEDETTNG